MNTSDNQPPEPWPDADRETQSQAGNEPDQPSQFILQRNGQLGHFSLQRQLGGGGFGHVYLAWDNKLRREVAIKVPRWDRPLTPRTQERFLHEGRMLAQVHHPCIAAVHEVGVTNDGLPFVVMSYIRGRSMSECLKQTHWSLDEKLQILIQIADTLQQAHKQGLTHRDLKPANIIINDQLQIAIVDFGLALHDDLAPSQLGDASAVGTPVYMAPEQIRGENHLIDGRTDVWALGVIMYVLLTQRLPFVSRDHRELIRAICYKHPRPLRQLNDQIPHELERICLRCLQKLMDDRYPSMADVRDELQSYVAEQRDHLEAQRVLAIQLSKPSVQTLQSISPILGSDSATAPPVSHQSGDPSRPSAPSAPSGPPSSSRVLAEIVPRGLRAFDQTDSEFFLQLLPGPVDRHGIPQSLRFLLSRLGTEHQVDSIPIMVIYGPSGSGKSSLIRAGLMPRLPNDVIPIYIDCTTDNLCQTIRDRLHREFAEMREVTDLADLIRQIRQGQFLRAQDKILLVLDQFEQWLSRPEALEPNELTEALRQCEASRIQVVLLLRDDFWMTATLFLKELGQRIEDGRNALVIPLFDERHARRVLEMFGRAHGALPPASTPLNKQQKKFIEQAVSAIAKQGKVVCIHLVVLAETIKDREWGQRDYQSLGGWEGIGREYIAGIFNNPQTPSFVKRHADDAWHILRLLLPHGQEKIKGQALPLVTVQNRSGLTQHDTRFQELVRFLEFEARLIAPLEDENALESNESKSQENRSNALYGLTHDFLVAPIRAWGQAIQNETPAGRAEHLFQHLAQQWELTGDKRFLPSLGDYQRILRFVPQPTKHRFKKYWNATQVKAWRQLTILGLLVLSLGWIVRERIRADYRNRAELFLSSPGSTANSYLEELPTMRSWAKQVFQTNLASTKLQKQFRAQCALWKPSSTSNSELKSLLALWSQVDPSEFGILLSILRPHALNVLPAVREKFLTDLPLIQKARTAILAQHLGDADLVQSMCSLSSDPNLRSTIMEQWLELPCDWGLLLGDQDTMVDKIPGDYLHAVFCTMAQLSPAEINDSDLQRITKTAKDVFQSHPSAGAHTSAKSLLIHWNQNIENPYPQPPKDASWKYVEIPFQTKSGVVEPLLFVQIPAGKVPLTDELIAEMKLDPATSAQIDEAFWISAYEAPQSLFDEFISSLPADHPCLKVVGSSDLEAGFLANKQPASRVAFSSWLQAVYFCNWLSESVLNCQPTYEISEAKLAHRTTHTKGFRLPTFSEHDRAQRAESNTTYYFGDDPALLDRHIQLGTLNSAMLGGLFIPNGFGCFDLLG